MKPYFIKISDLLFRKGLQLGYKDTLNLPKTTFPMKGNLAQLEPKILEFWQEIKLNQKLLEDSSEKPLFVLHDGPPYANGDIHLGHTLNKVLKDLIVKYKRMTGYYSPFVPGWDCHGQPIEHEVEKRLKKENLKVSQEELRKRCRDYALKFVKRQSQQFQRLGVTGDWEKPYLTLDFSYEAANIRIFRQLFEERLIYKGRKPIHWCYQCQTALAEAEIEYTEEVSPSIYLKFPLIGEFAPLKKFSQPKYLLAWTTTPWTLPANVAVALHPEAEYAAVLAGEEIYIVVKNLVGTLAVILGQKGETLATFKGKELEGFYCSHPLKEENSRIVLADFVALDQGTGCVHIAPGHGEEDYFLGLRYNLPAPMPVNDRGYFTKEAGKFAGKHILEANPLIVEDLKSRNLLAHLGEVTHSYPHCWRCKNPVIFRATEQWFVSMDSPPHKQRESGDKKNLRQESLEAIKTVKWVPSWSIRRITSMVTERPDWCISRQRAWGVPLPVFYCQSCNQELVTTDTLKYVEEVFSREGADSWFKKKAEELLPPGTACSLCGNRKFRKEKDILDVWFESGVSHEAVLKSRQNLSWPADLYLEGSDQHRGWFQTSLLTAAGTQRKAPYKGVLTHGFLVDGQGRKMSKSLGNVIDPLEVIAQSGADILRLWVCSADYSSDIAISPEILQRIIEAYRRIRNTFRFLLGNLADFDLQKDQINRDDLEEIDRWALMRFHQLLERVLKAYSKYKFHLIFHSVYNFCTLDLSAFYLDVLKDRLYTFAANSKPRRAAQTVMLEILKGLLKLLAPVLSFTAEEVWQLLPPGSKEEVSVHLTTMPSFDPSFIDPILGEDWDKLMKLRGEVAKALEEARAQKKIGDSLEAKVSLYLPKEFLGVAKKYEKQLSTIFIVSQSEIESPGTLPKELWRSEIYPGLAVKVVNAEGKKCARCWNWRVEVGTDKEFPELCSRCISVVSPGQPARA